MSTLTSLGIGSGLDVESIITKLMSIERQPISQLTTKESSVKSKISAFGTLSSLVSTLKDAATTLSDPSKLAAYKATFADTSIASASTTSSAANGSYSINVKQLATAHKIASDTNFTGISQVVGEGRFTLTVGTTSTQIETGTNATLGDLRDAINQADAGVKASLVSGDNGTKLVLTASDPGKKIAVSSVQDLNGGDAGDFATLLAGFTTVGGPHKISTDAAFSGPTEQVGSGTLNITLAGTTTSVSVGANATLQDVATAINDTYDAQGGSNPRVTASIVTDSTGTHLQLLSSDQDSLISYTAIDNSGSDNLNFAKLRGYSTVGTTPQIAQKAILEIDGQTVTSDTNTVTSAINGVTLNLTKTGSTTFTVARDTSGISDAVNTFVSAYNGLNSKIKSLTAYDTANKSGSVLTGDSTVRSIANQLSAQMFGSGGSNSAIDTLSDLGISFQKDGNGAISVDSTKLNNAISSDFEAVISTLGNYGTKFKDLTNKMVASDGLISSRTDSLNNSIKDYQDRIDSLELRMTTIEKNYRSQYSALDTMVASMQQTSSYLTQQLAKL
jgi:flagellar hook-associated protein 2